VARAIPNAEACFFEPGVNHSLISRFDAPDEDKFWLPAVESQIARFVATGEPFDTTDNQIYRRLPLGRPRH